jgi:sec-independent protein translocase protein TatA
MGSFSPIHWVIVLIIVLLLFGPGRLAGVGKGLGEGIRAFKKGISDDEHPDDEKDGPKQLPPQKLTRVEEEARAADKAEPKPTSTPEKRGS